MAELKRPRGRQIRVANAPYLGTNPFRLLSELDFVSYSENLPAENARRLHEAVVDIALIPVSEFAAHGGYVGLDYGLACRRRSQGVILAARCRPQKLTTVYLYEAAATSAHLLRLLLKERWHNSPRLVRSSQLDPRSLGETEGMLVLEDTEELAHRQLPIQEDLVAAWDRLTQRPFPFLVWALRPGVLSLKQLRAFHEQLGRSSTVVEPLIREAAESQGVPVERSQRFWSECYSYYFDESVLLGLDTFFKKAAEQRILPVCSYRSATFTLFEKRSYGALRERPIEDVLTGVVDGERLSMNDALRLVTKASTAELGMAADLLRAKLFPERTLSETLFVDPHEDPGSLAATLETACTRGIWHVVLMPTLLQPLQAYVDFVASIRARGPFWIEGFTIPQLQALATGEKLELAEVVSRLVTAGLNSVSGRGAGMLTVAALRRERSTIDLDSWIGSIRSIQRYGVSMPACINLHAKDSWEERIVHLHTLRGLQDEQPGFRSFSVEFGAGWPAGTRDTELKLRACMLSRLFLDNISTFSETRLLEDSLAGTLAPSFGVNQIVVQHGQHSLHNSEVTLKVLRRLGMEFSMQQQAADSVGTLQ